MTEFNDDGGCFVCGPKNHRGLHLDFKENKEQDLVESEVNFPPEFQGWGNVVHGGLLSTVLDEVMIKAAVSKGYKCVTAEITVKFRRPAHTGETLQLTGRVKEVKRKLIFTEGLLRDRQNNILASATARLFIVT
jgi:uncharacterized protein (TIGR00369 family)